MHHEPGASGSAEFDRARALLEEGRSEEALDLFEVATVTAGRADVRASAAAFVCGTLLAAGRPWEVDSFVAVMRDAGGNPALAALLDASARLQLGDVDGARALLHDLDGIEDPWFPCSPTAARLVRAHARYLAGDTDAAGAEVLALVAADPGSPEVWEAFARLCATPEFDPAPALAGITAARLPAVLAALRTADPTGADRIVDHLWQRQAGDVRLLVAAAELAPRLAVARALEWSVRLRSAGMGRSCPLLARAELAGVAATERAETAALVHASFGDSRARAVLEAAIAAVADADLAPTVARVWTLAPALADSAVVAGATTARRALAVAAELFAGGAVAESYAVLVHGLSLDDAESLTTEEVTALLPVATIEGLAEHAEAAGEDDVAGILEAVALVAAAGAA